MICAWTVSRIPKPNCHSERSEALCAIARFQRDESAFFRGDTNSATNRRCERLFFVAGGGDFQDS
jgi:hypothetical protein